MNIQIKECNIERIMVDEYDNFNYTFKSRKEIIKALIYALYRTGHCNVFIKVNRKKPISYEFRIDENGKLFVVWRKEIGKGKILENDGDIKYSIADIITAIEYKDTNFKLTFSSNEDNPDIRNIFEVTNLLYRGYSVLDDETIDSYYKNGSKIRQWYLMKSRFPKTSVIIKSMSINNDYKAVDTYQDAIKKVETKMQEFDTKLEGAYQLYRKEFPKEWDLVKSMLETGLGYSEAAKFANEYNENLYQEPNKVKKLTK